MSITVNVIINFTSNVNDGCHQVYYGTDPGGPFTGPVAVSCATGLGVPCVATVPIVVDNDTCEPTFLYGYIQACCNDNELGKIPWSAVYTPEEPCGQVLFACTDPAGCGAFDAGIGCNGAFGNTTGGIADGESFSLCYPGGNIEPAIQSAAEAQGYTVTENPPVEACCNDCIDITVTLSPTVGSMKFMYEQCCGSETGTLQQIIAAYPDVVTETVCARRNSWASSNPANTTVVEGSPCGCILL